MPSGDVELDALLLPVSCMAGLALAVMVAMGDDAMPLSLLLLIGRSLEAQLDLLVVCLCLYLA